MMLTSKLGGFLFCITLMISCSTSKKQGGAGKWIKLFDGKTFNGWQASENKNTFIIENGLIKMDGPRSHLYYTGSVNGHVFKNFEFKISIKTMPKANSGIYFHTQYKERGYPDKGYESQINNTHTDWRKTGSLYDVDDIKENLVKDNEWFDMHIKVVGKQITISVNNTIVKKYTEPEDIVRPQNPGRVLGSGTFAIQAHDPKSIAWFKNIYVKVLPD